MPSDTTAPSPSHASSESTLAFLQDNTESETPAIGACLIQTAKVLSDLNPAANNHPPPETLWIAMVEKACRRTGIM